MIQNTHESIHGCQAFRQKRGGETTSRSLISLHSLFANKIQSGIINRKTFSLNHNSGESNEY